MERFASDVMWAKCDMVATVCFERLDLFRDGRGTEGKRKYYTPRVCESDLALIRNGILISLGLTPVDISA